MLYILVCIYSKFCHGYVWSTAWIITFAVLGYDTCFCRNLIHAELLSLQWCVIIPGSAETSYKQNCYFYSVVLWYLLLYKLHTSRIVIFTLLCCDTWFCNLTHSKFLLLQCFVNTPVCETTHNQNCYFESVTLWHLLVQNPIAQRYSLHIWRFFVNTHGSNNKCSLKGILYPKTRFWNIFSE